MDHEFKWLELKVKLQEEALFYTKKMKEEEGNMKRLYSQGSFDQTVDILKWMMEEEKVEGEPKTSEGGD